MDKTEEMLQLWCSAPGIKFINAEAEQAYKKRAKRIAAVIQLKVPDRVPIVPSFGMFPALDNRFTCEEVMFDYDKAHRAWMKTLTDFEPDMYLGSSYAFPGPVLEALDYRQLRLPGRGVSSNHVYQFVEREYVKADEFYDAFISDPLSRAGAEATKWARVLAAQSREIMGMGFPLYEGGGAAAPFDIIGDWFRGTRGVMIDMYRRPDKLIEAMERLVPMLIKMGVDQTKQSGHPIVGLMLHKGAEGFMSIEQYKTFYWPTLRKVMMGLIDEGLVPMSLFEGDYTSRLEIIKDIPHGKAIYWFEKVDIYKAKKILGDTACFRGNVPITLLCIGTPQEVKEYVKELIDVVGKGGGLMVDCGVWFDEAKHENVKAMVDFTKEYGVYR